MKRDDVNLTTVPVPFYQSMWFILVVSLAAMVVTVVILTAFIQKRGRKLPNSDMTEVNFPKSGTARSRDTEGLSFGMSELGPFNSDESLHSYSVQVKKMLNLKKLGGWRIKRGYDSDFLK